MQGQAWRRQLQGGDGRKHFRPGPGRQERRRQRRTGFERRKLGKLGRRLAGGVEQLLIVQRGLPVELAEGLRLEPGAVYAVVVVEEELALPADELALAIKRQVLAAVQGHHRVAVLHRIAVALDAGPGVGNAALMLQAV
ncbi:hypothetical protein D9M71_515160 [compost metagenome]